MAARQSGDSCSGGHAESEAHQRYLDSCSREEAYAEACRDVAEWAELMVEAQDNGEPGEADVCRRRMALHVAAMKAARDR